MLLAGSRNRSKARAVQEIEYARLLVPLRKEVICLSSSGPVRIATSRNRLCHQTRGRSTPLVRAPAPFQALASSRNPPRLAPGHGRFVLPSPRTGERPVSDGGVLAARCSLVRRGGFDPDGLSGMVLFDGPDGIGDQFPISQLVDEPTEVRMLQLRVVSFGDRVAATPDGVIRLGGAKGIS